MNYKKLSQVLEQINDKSISQKKREQEEAIKALTNKGGKIHTITIITLQNPNGSTLPAGRNKALKKDFLKALKSDPHPYVPIQGHFGGDSESSYMVFNWSQQTAEYYASKYEQESYWFVKVYEDHFDAEYWCVSDDTKPFDKKYNPHVKYNETSEAFTSDDMTENYSQIGKKLKFAFPYEAMQKVDQLTDSSSLWMTIYGVGHSSYEHSVRAYHKVKDALEQLDIVVDTRIEGKLTVGNLNDEVNALNQMQPSLPEQNFDDFWNPLRYKFPAGTKLKYSLSNYASQNAVYTIPAGKLIISFEQIDE